MAGPTIKGDLKLDGYTQTNASATANNHVLTYKTGTKTAVWAEPPGSVSFLNRAFHYVEYNFTTGMLEENYPVDGEDFIIDPLIEYQGGLIQNEFELRDDGFLVYRENL